jgi:hypothetical protein
MPIFITGFIAGVLLWAIFILLGSFIIYSQNEHLAIRLENLWKYILGFGLSFSFIVSLIMEYLI